MTFVHDFLDFGDCDKLGTVTINGRRHYMVNGMPYPSVTTVLGSVPKPALDEWRAKVGEVEAEKITRMASDRGSALHSLVELYLLNQPINNREHMPHILQMFHWVKPHLDKHVGRILGIECALYSDSLAMAGRADLIAEWDGEPAIIDFKTSTKQKRREWMDGYFQQCATYSYMVYERIQLMVPKTVLIVATEATNCAEVFEERCATRIPEIVEIVAGYQQKVLTEG